MQLLNDKEAVKRMLTGITLLQANPVMVNYNSALSSLSSLLHNILSSSKKITISKQLKHTISKQNGRINLVLDTGNSRKIEIVNQTIHNNPIAMLVLNDLFNLRNSNEFDKEEGIVSFENNAKQKSTNVSRKLGTSTIVIGSDLGFSIPFLSEECLFPGVISNRVNCKDTLDLYFSQFNANDCVVKKYIDELFNNDESMKKLIQLMKLNEYSRDITNVRVLMLILYGLIEGTDRSIDIVENSTSVLSHNGKVLSIVSNSMNGTFHCDEKITDADYTGKDDKGVGYSYLFKLPNGTMLSDVDASWSSINEPLAQNYINSLVSLLVNNINY